MPASDATRMVPSSSTAGAAAMGPPVSKVHEHGRRCGPREGTAVRVPRVEVQHRGGPALTLPSAARDARAGVAVACRSERADGAVRIVARRAELAATSRRNDRRKRAPAHDQVSLHHAARCLSATRIHGADVSTASGARQGLRVKSNR